MHICKLLLQYLYNSHPCMYDLLIDVMFHIVTMSTYICIYIYTCVNYLLSNICVAPVADGKVRLMSGSKSTEGRVEIYHNGKWGTVCDDFWDILDAHVVCKELNFTRALQAKSYAHFGVGQDPIWLDDVECTGSEKRLVDCKHNGWGSHNCMHTEDAGVICSKALNM